MPSNVLNNFDTFVGRQALRQQYITHLQNSPFNFEMMERFINHVRTLLSNERPYERDVLSIVSFSLCYALALTPSA